jgi:hypothetical protein
VWSGSTNTATTTPCLHTHALPTLILRFKRLNEKHLHLQASYEDLQQQYEQQEATLVEMGSVHAQEKLEMSELRGRQRRMREAQMQDQVAGKGGKKPQARPAAGKGGDKREFANNGINFGALTGQR